MALLNDADLQSPTWAKLRKHFDERLAEHRAKNDCKLNTEDTAHIRGRIAEARYFLSLMERDTLKPPG